MLAVWVVLELYLYGKSGRGAAGSHYSMLVFFLSMLQPAVSVANGSGLVSARLWIGINTMDKAIKALFVPFVTTGWGLKQSVFYQCQRCDETWLTQEANGIKASICQPCSRPDWSKRTRTNFYGSPKLFSPCHFLQFICNSLTSFELQGSVKKEGESVFTHLTLLVVLVCLFISPNLCF